MNTKLDQILEFEAKSAALAADVLHAAWRDGTTLAYLPYPGRPVTVAQGYEIQRRLLKLHGEVPVGWKLGATSQATMENLGLEEPIVGRMLPSGMLASDTSVPFSTFHAPAAEAEIALRLGQDLPLREQAWSMEEIASAVDGVYLGIELADSRFTDASKTDWPSLIADNAVTSHYVLGPRIEADVDKLPQKACLFVDNQAVLTANPFSWPFDPVQALHFLANAPHITRVGLRAGEIITTGALLGPHPIRSPCHLRFELDEVSVAIELS